MLSGISRVRKVRVSAWLGRTEDSSGCRRTSSNVSPRRMLDGMSGASLSWAISAHGRAATIRQVSLGLDPLQHALSGLDVHPFDHLVAEPLGAAVKGVDHRPRALNLGYA